MHLLGHVQCSTIIQLNLPVRPPLVSKHLLLATTFPKYQNVLSQITTVGTSRRQPPLVSNCSPFLGNLRADVSCFLCLRETIFWADSLNSALVYNLE